MLVNISHYVFLSFSPTYSRSCIALDMIVRAKFRVKSQILDFWYLKTLIFKDLMTEVYTINVDLED